MQKKNVSIEQENVINEKLNSFRKSCAFDFKLNDNIYYILARAYYDDNKLERCNDLKENDTLNLIFKGIDERYDRIVTLVKKDFTTEELEYLLTNSKSVERFIEDAGNMNISMPESIIELGYNFMEIKDGDIVYNPFAQGGEMIEYINRNNPNVLVEGIEYNIFQNIICNIRKDILKEKANINNLNPFIIRDYEINNEINKIFCMPPILKNSFSDIKENSDELEEFINKNNVSKNSNLFYIVKNLIELKNLDKAVYIYPTHLIASFAERSVIEYLVENRYIEGIIQLPERLFKNINISFSMIIISKNNESIKFVDSSENFEKEKSMNVLNDNNINKIISEYKDPRVIGKELEIEKVISNDYMLLPKMIIIPEELLLKEYYILGDIADIQRGIVTLSKEKLADRESIQRTKYKYLEAKDLSETLDINELKDLNEIKDSEKKYIVQDGDIIISKVQNFKSMIFENVDSNEILVSGNLYRIIIKADIDPYYIQAYFVTDHANNQIERLTSGGTTKTLSINNLNKLKIPKVSKEKELEIAENYIKIIRKTKTIKEQFRLLEIEKNVNFDGVI